jgi:hypothetical protein
VVFLFIIILITLNQLVMNLCDFQVDVPIKYLNFFLEDDDELERIKKVLLQTMLHID